jgi:CRP-like cAMP-binding protein
VPSRASDSESGYVKRGLAARIEWRGSSSRIEWEGSDRPEVMDQQQQLRRKLQERKRLQQDEKENAGRQPASPRSILTASSLAKPAPATRPRPTTPPQPAGRERTISFEDDSGRDAPRAHHLVNGKVRPLHGRLQGAHAATRSGTLPAVRSPQLAPEHERPAAGHARSNGNGLAYSAAGRGMESAGRVAGSAVAAVATTAGSVAAAAVSTAGSAATAAATVAGSAASAAARSTGCIARTQSTMFRIDLLGEVPLFSGISPAQMEKVADSMEVMTASAGQIIIQQGDTGDEMYVVETGRLEVTVVTKDGKRLGVVKEYTSGTFFGELALLSDAGTLRSATVTAAERSRLLILRRESVADMLQKGGLYRTLGTVPLFAGLPPPKLHQIGNSLVKRQVTPGQVIIKQGDSGDEMFVVESGRLEASVVTPEGKNIGVVKTYGGGEYFGELALMSDEPRSATVTATDEGTLLVLQRAVVTQLLESGKTASQPPNQLKRALLDGPRYSCCAVALLSQRVVALSLGCLALFSTASVLLPLRPLHLCRTCYALQRTNLVLRIEPSFNVVQRHPCLFLTFAFVGVFRIDVSRGCGQAQCIQSGRSDRERGGARIFLLQRSGNRHPSTRTLLPGEGHPHDSPDLVLGIMGAV